MPSSKSYSELKKSDFFEFFNLREIERQKLSKTVKKIKLKPGGFQEHIDIEFKVKNDLLVSAKLILDRQWIGSAKTINPFGKDIAKSFIVAVIPSEERESVRNLVHFLFNLRGNEDIIIPVQKVYQFYEKSEPEIEPFLDVYRNQKKHAEFGLKDSKFIIKNIHVEEIDRLVIKWLKI
ncbi:MAG: hypothetical protein EU539_02205 [Promethearchaeota archaeon]|nr:MAG: hypothetical protein EU539_02205 [Candidatus Lokiarchaeota archaeon]